MADVYEIMRSANALASAVQPPPYMMATLRAIEEERKRMQFMREMEPAIEFARIAQERTETARRLAELSSIGRTNDLALYRATSDAAERLMGSSIHAMGALEREAERQRAMASGIAAVGSLQWEATQQAQRLHEQLRVFEGIAESTRVARGCGSERECGSNHVSDACRGPRRSRRPWGRSASRYPMPQMRQK